ncbi:hypothetical protein LSAT2_011683 [Lamellibrachia satsuma]|nr:hypothetical protein LSAT2_011683 [Lamellibrachia satsuma]
MNTGHAIDSDAHENERSNCSKADYFLEKSNWYWNEKICHGVKGDLQRITKSKNDKCPFYRPDSACLKAATQEPRLGLVRSKNDWKLYTENCLVVMIVKATDSSGNIDSSPCFWALSTHKVTQRHTDASSTVGSVSVSEANTTTLTTSLPNEEASLESDLKCRDIWWQIGLPPERVLPFGMWDNLCEMGKSGPCGP